MSNGTSDAIPRQRTKDLVVRAHGEETLVLDRRTGTVHCLPAEVARVWGACTGSNSLAEVASAARIDEVRAAAAVEQLMLLNLFDGCCGCDRRKFLRRGVVIGAGVAAMPVIESVIASPAGAAASPPRNAVIIPVCTGGSVTNPTPGGKSNGRLSNFYITLNGWTTPGVTTGNTTYYVLVTLGPVPDTSIASAGTTYTATGSITVPNNTGNSTQVNILPSNVLGSVPALPNTLPPVGDPTPYTVQIFSDSGRTNLIKTFTGYAGPCWCAPTYCHAPVQFTATPSCRTGTTAATAALTYTITGHPSTAYYFVTSPVASTGTINATTNASGVFTTPLTVSVGTQNSFPDSGGSVPITVEVHQNSATGPIVATDTFNVGPCPNTPNVDIAVSYTCGTGSAANTLNLTWTVTGAAVGLVYYSYATFGGTDYGGTTTTATGGTFIRTITNFVGTNAFSSAGDVTVTLRVTSATGPIAKQVTATVGPCPDTPNLDIAPVTYTCTSSGSGQTTLAWTVTGAAPSVTYYSYATYGGTNYGGTGIAASAAGTISRTGVNVGALNAFSTATDVTVTVRLTNASGPIAKQVTATVGPCPPAAADSSPAPTGSP